MLRIWLWPIPLCLLAHSVAFASQLSLLDTAVLGQSNGSLLSRAQPEGGMIPQPNAPVPSLLGSGSLFSGRAEGSLFQPRPKLQPALPDTSSANSAPPRFTHRGVRGLRDLIASAEAGRAGYDAVQYGARIRPAKPPTQMTIKEIYQWIDATPGQPHAIGRYQMIPPTLRRVVSQLGIKETALFTPQVQDLCADLLMDEAGLSAFLAGDLSRVGFMNNLAKVWAGLPNSTGKSHYHGYAGNAATISWAQFERVMAAAFPRG